MAKYVADRVFFGHLKKLPGRVTNFYILFTSQSKRTQCEEHNCTLVALTAQFNSVTYDELKAQCCMNGLVLPIQ